MLMYVPVGSDSWALVTPGWSNLVFLLEAKTRAQGRGNRWCSDMQSLGCPHPIGKQCPKILSWCPFSKGMMLVMWGRWEKGTWKSQLGRSSALNSQMRVRSSSGTADEDDEWQRKTSAWGEMEEIASVSFRDYANKDWHSGSVQKN